MLFTHIHLLFYCVVFLNNQRRHPEVMSLLATTILSLSLSSLNCYQTNFHHRQLRVCRLAGRASIFLTFAARSSQRSIICVGKDGGSCDACDVLGSVSGWRTSFRRTSFVVQTKILDCETSITHKMSFWRQKLSQFVRKFVSQNKAKNAGRSGKNAGNTSKCGISRTIAGWLTPMTYTGLKIAISRHRRLTIVRGE